MAGASPPHSQPRVMRLQAQKAPPPRIWPGLRAGRQAVEAGRLWGGWCCGVVVL
jgi:hypothetical protein